MEACGRSCYFGAYGDAPATVPTDEKVQGFLKCLRDKFGPQSVRTEGNQTIIDFAYIANPRGLRVADGYCLCPVLEDGPVKLSPTYCQCSVGTCGKCLPANSAGRSKSNWSTPCGAAIKNAALPFVIRRDQAVGGLNRACEPSVD